MLEVVLVVVVVLVLVVEEIVHSEHSARSMLELDFRDLLGGNSVVK